MRKADYTKTGVIFNIQKFSVNDGPGLRTTIFLKGCPLRCRWCSNPESQLIQTQLLWDQKKCLHCLHCLEICPVGAISFPDNHLSVNINKCIGCGRCRQTCPGKALETEGEVKTVKDVMDVVLQDKVFYEESNGGITLSGGELLAQPDFSTELLLAAKENELHTCCETTGYAVPEIFNRVTEFVDYILFDMKHWDASRHKLGTGVTNELPLTNMRHAIDEGKEVLPRIPVIPGFNDSLDDAAAFAKTLHQAGSQRCQLLPFHQFGENKYHLLNQKYDYEEVPSLHAEDLQEYQNILLHHGINAFF